MKFDADFRRLLLINAGQIAFTILVGVLLALSWIANLDAALPPAP